jgi:hypothetical protein
MGVEDRLEAKPEDDCRTPAGPRIVKLRPPQGDDYRRQRPAEAAREPGGEFILTEEPVRPVLQPINQRRLVEPRLIVEIRDDEIPTLQHLPRRLGESWLVAIHQRQSPIPGGVKRQKGKKQQQQPLARHPGYHSELPFRIQWFRANRPLNLNLHLNLNPSTRSACSGPLPGLNLNPNAPG